MASLTPQVDKISAEPNPPIVYTSGSVPVRAGRYGEPSLVDFEAGPGENGLLDTVLLGDATTLDLILAPRAYWQIRVTELQGGQYQNLVLRELAFLDASATEISTAGGTPFGSPADVGYMPAQAFDHDPTTAYFSNGSIASAGELFLGMQFATPVTVRGVALTASSNNNNSPKTFELRASSDGINWVVVNSVTGAPNWPSTETQYFFVAPGVTTVENVGLQDVVDGEVVSIPPIPPVLAETSDSFGMGDTASAAIAGGSTIEGEGTDQANFLDTVDYIYTPGARVVEGLAFNDVVTTNWAKSIVEQLRVAEIGQGNFRAAVDLVERLRLTDSLRSTADVMIIETLGVSTMAAAVAALQIIERLGLTDTLALTARQTVTLNERIRFQTSLEKFLDGLVVEGLGLQENNAVVLRALQALLETIGMQEVVSPRLLVSMVLTETVKLTDSALTRMLWSGKIVEGIELSIGYFGIGGEYTAWTMNTRTNAVTEYQNFAFNSFARVGNKYLGASDDGLYELSGDTDAGEDIVATLRGGYMQFGGTRMSRLKEAYVSVRAPNGKVFLKIVTADGDEYAYEVDTRSMRNTKVHMGKGMRARYFAYELVTEGQDFDLDSIEFVPIVVQRRV